MALIEPGPFQKLWAGLRTRWKSSPSSPSALPPDSERNVAWRQDGPEPGVWAEIVAREDGLYSFAEWKRQWITAPKAGTWETEFPIYESGLYDSEEAARLAMMDQIDWLRS